MEAKMNILFIGKKQRLTRHGLLPIYVRVTIQSKRFEVSTNHHVKPVEWSPVGGKVIDRSDSALAINMALDVIRCRVHQYREQLQKEARELSVEAIHDKWFGQDREKRTLMGVVRLSILDLQKLVSKGSYKKSRLPSTSQQKCICVIIWKNTRDPDCSRIRP